MLSELFTKVNEFFDKKHQVTHFTVNENRDQIVEYFHDLSTPFDKRFVTYEKNHIVKPKHHKMTTLEGFIKYILGLDKETKETTQVFVGPSFITAHMNPNKNHQDYISLDLISASEFKSFNHICDGFRSQKDFWRLLSTQLKDCIDEKLLQIMCTIKFDAKSQSNFSIDNTGLVSGNANRSVKITWEENGGTAEQELQVDYSYNGRIWECFDSIMAIPCRLEVAEQDNLPTFTLNPIRKDASINDMKSRLVQHIQSELKEIKVFEGIYGISD